MFSNSKLFFTLSNIDFAFENENFLVLIYYSCYDTINNSISFYNSSKCSNAVYNSLNEFHSLGKLISSAVLILFLRKSL